MSALDLDRARETFESSTDFTIGLEEEFAIVNPETLELEHRFEDVYAACRRDEVLAEAAAGELIASEIEIRSGRSETFADAVVAQQERRNRLFGLVEGMGLGLAATGTHPWADYLDQRIIDTPHYNRLEEELGWVAQRNNTWSLHVHMGVRGADRAIAVCDRLRELLPVLLAASANSPFLDRRDTGLQTVRTEIFTRTFPRCGIPSPFVDWDTYEDFVRILERTGTAVESTQLWWSVRPHHTLRHGRGADLRRADARRRGVRARRPDRRLHRPDRARLRRARLRRGGAAARRPRDRGEPLAGDPPRDGRRVPRLPRRAAPSWSRRGRRSSALLAWTEPARARLGIQVDLPARNGAQRARDSLASGASIEDIYREAVGETKRTYTADVGARS